jgi:flagellar basal-body rod modification protein FlgD
MIANEIDSSTAGGSLLSGSRSNVLDKDDFLNLLVTQLQHQDPLNPTDSVEFTAQLAQFSSLEQLGNVNDNLSDLKNFQASLNNSQAISLIDKAITADGNAIVLEEGGSADCHFELDEDAANVTISIYDATGKYMGRVEGEKLRAGKQVLSWNGTDSRGNRVAPGVYSFELQAEDAKAQPVLATPLFRGIVDRVVFENNTSFLICGSQKIAMGDVLEVAASQNTPIATQVASAAAPPSNPMINGGK